MKAAYFKYFGLKLVSCLDPSPPLLWFDRGWKCRGRPGGWLRFRYERSTYGSQL